MRELVLNVPVNMYAFPPPTRQWLLQPVPHGLRITGLALFGHSAAYPAAAVPQDLLLMQISQLEDIQHLELPRCTAPRLASNAQTVRAEIVICARHSPISVAKPHTDDA